MTRRSLTIAAALIGLVALTAPMNAQTQVDSFLLRNVTVHPITAAKQDDVSLLVVDGKIAAIAKNVSAPRGTRTIEGRGLHVFPGMIDSATDTGLSEISAVDVTVDTGELGEFNPQIRAAVAVNPSSEHFPVVRANGTTSMLLLPGGASARGGFGGGNQKPRIIQGQASMIHTDGWTWEEMEVSRGAGLQLRWPRVATVPARFAAMAGQGNQTSYADLKKRQQDEVKQLSDFFESARRYQKAKAANDATLQADLKLEAMLPVLEGKRPVVIIADSERYIKEAVDFAKKEKIRMVLAGASEYGDSLALLKANGIPVIVGPTYQLPPEADMPYDYSATLPGEIFKAGVKFCFGSYGTQFARNLPYNVANAVAYGLPYDEAIKGLTIYPAEIWGMADRIGSVEKGKWADLIVVDKEDPLETTTNVKFMFILGREVDLESKHTKLYEKYLNRPKRSVAAGSQ